jgi:hypothetical protein
MPPLEVLRTELSRRGLPRGYVDRACAELEAHIADSARDLIAGGCSPHQARKIAGERLGCPVSLADRLYRQQVAVSLWLRHPLAVTVLVSTGLFLMLGLGWLGMLAALWRSMPAAWLDAAHLMGRLVIPAAGSAILLRLFSSRLGNRRWARLAVAILLLLSATAVIRVTPLAGGHASAMLRFIPPR